MIVELHTDLATENSLLQNISKALQRTLQSCSDHRTAGPNQEALLASYNQDLLSRNCDIDHRARPPAKLDFMNLIKLTQKC